MLGQDVDKHTWETPLWQPEETGTWTRYRETQGHSAYRYRVEGGPHGNRSCGCSDAMYRSNMCWTRRTIMILVRTDPQVV